MYFCSRYISATVLEIGVPVRNTTPEPPSRHCVTLIIMFSALIDPAGLPRPRTFCKLVLYGTFL